MHVEGVAIIPSCAECGDLWLPVDDERWQAYLTDDEPAEVAFYCPSCAEREVPLVSRGANTEDEIHREVSNRANRRILPDGSQVEQPRAR